MTILLNSSLLIFFFYSRRYLSYSGEKKNDEFYFAHNRFSLQLYIKFPSINFFPSFTSTSSHSAKNMRSFFYLSLSNNFWLENTDTRI